jgi:hypothetical protein
MYFNTMFVSYSVKIQPNITTQLIEKCEKNKK